jgi:protease-4
MKAKKEHLLYAGVGIAALALVILLSLAIASLAGGAPIGEGCVGVIDIKGELVAEGSSGNLFSQGVMGSEDVAKLIEETDKRSDVKAVVFVIDSPGGSVVASREIYSAVKNMKKPSVAYFREMAASGAYYVGAGTDYIVSDPDALTGSIGVITTVADLSSLFEKIGVNMTSIKSGAYKDMGAMERPMNDKERAIMQSIVDEIFSEFKGAVVEGRGDRLNMAGFEKILDGRVLTGRQAEKIGLVDEIGDKKRAIEKAGEMAGLKEPAVCEIKEGGGLFGGIFSSAAKAVADEMLKGMESNGRLKINA